MPYVQLFIKGQHPTWDKQTSPSPDLSEVNARKELQELCERFPLQQSEGIFYRMNHDSVLFEQPEHLSLTLEQEVWLEQHGYDTLGKKFLEIVGGEIVRTVLVVLSWR